MNRKDRRAMQKIKHIMNNPPINGNGLYRPDVDEVEVLRELGFKYNLSFMDTAVRLIFTSKQKTIGIRKDFIPVDISIESLIRGVEHMIEHDDMESSNDVLLSFSE